MNVDRAQHRYVFRPPRYAAWFRPFQHLLATFFLRFRFHIRNITLRGEQHLAQLVHQRHSVLVTPNHADHADPSLLVEVGRRLGFAFHFMAAREAFERGRLNGYVLQRSGAFSIDREGADLASIRTAMNILRACRHPLVIFPEGEIYHHHEELDLLNDGVATILLRAAEKLPDGSKAYAVPSAIRIRHHPSVIDTFPARLDVLEQRITWKPRRDVKTIDRIYRLGSALLSIKEEEFMGRSRPGDLAERLRFLQTFLVDDVEAQLHFATEPAAIPSRIKSLRQVIRRELIASRTPPSAPRRICLEEQLDHLFVAQQLYSYPGRYLSSQPSVDRVAETLFKLEEDVLGAGTYPVPRTAEISFGEPIDVGTFLRDGGWNPRSGVRPLTELLRRRIEERLGETGSLNAAHTLPANA